MLTRENKITLAFAAAALVVAVGVDLFTSASDLLVVAVVIVVGVLLPRLLAPRL